MSSIDVMRAERKAKDFMKGIGVMRTELTKLKREVADLQERVRQLEAHQKKQNP